MSPRGHRRRESAIERPNAPRVKAGAAQCAKLSHSHPEISDPVNKAVAFALPNATLFTSSYLRCPHACRRANRIRPPKASRASVAGSGVVPLPLGVPSISKAGSGPLAA